MKPITAEIRVGIYARVSTTDQNCAMQLRELREYAAARGWQVVAEYVDTGFSGSKSSRPALDLMMTAARERRLDIIIAWKIDRLSRSLSHLIQCVQQFDTWGVRFIAITQNIDTDQNNPLSRFFLQIMAAFAELEREQIRERVTAGVRNAGANGKILGRPRRVFDRQKARDLIEQGMTYRAVADELGVSLAVLWRGLKKEGAAK